MWDVSIDAIALLNPEKVTMALVNLPSLGSKVNTCKTSREGIPLSPLVFQIGQESLDGTAPFCRRRACEPCREQCAPTPQPAQVEVWGGNPCWDNSEITQGARGTPGEPVRTRQALSGAGRLGVCFLAYNSQISRSRAASSSSSPARMVSPMYSNRR